MTNKYPHSSYFQRTHTPLTALPSCISSPNGISLGKRVLLISVQANGPLFNLSDLIG